jgi:hypothetical protein
MEVPTPRSVLEALAELQEVLQYELDGPVRCLWVPKNERPRHKKESWGRQLELVKATWEQLAALGRGQRVSMGNGPGDNTQVRGSAKLSDTARDCGPLETLVWA